MRISRTKVKASEIFPLMGVFGGVAVSIKGAYTVGWELTLPTLYSQTEADYDALISTFESAVRTLPAWTMIHRQDRYTYDEWKPTTDRPGFLEEAYTKHFTGRRYLTHHSYLFLTFGTRYLMTKEGKASGIYGVTSVPPTPDDDKCREYLATAREFLSILTINSEIGARLLTEDEWLGTKDDPGIVYNHMMFGDRSGLMSDLSMETDCVLTASNKLFAFSIGESSLLPNEIRSVLRVEGLSTPNSNVWLSFASRIGTLLDCEHEVNQFILIPSQNEALKKLDRKRREMNAGTSSNDNRINVEQVSEYLDDVYKNDLFTVYSHMNILVWSDPSHTADISGKVRAALTSMGISAVQNRFDVPNLWYSAIPGNCTEIGSDSLMTAELRSVLAMGSYETFDAGFGEGYLRICDRTRHIPLHVDTHEIAVKRKLIGNYNKFVIGPSRTGKSFFMNCDTRNAYVAGAQVFIIDAGDSYEGVTQVINEETDGKDGRYLSWSAEHPLTFNPFLGWESWRDVNGNLNPDDPGVLFLLSFLKTLWEPHGGWKSETEPILNKIIIGFLDSLEKSTAKKGEKSSKVKKVAQKGLPVIDDFYAYLGKVDEQIKKGQFKNGNVKVTQRMFDIENLQNALTPYTRDGQFGFFMNDPAPEDLFANRWTVVEVDKLSQVSDSKFYSLVVLAIMNTFDRKMRTTPGKKVLVVDEAWKAIANETMAPYLRGLWKTAGKFSTSAVVVTQEIADVLSSETIKTAILANSDTKVLLDQRQNIGILTNESSKGDPSDIRTLLGLSDTDLDLLLSVNKGVDSKYNYKEVFFKFSSGYATVYATEVSPEEALAYESNKEAKRPMLELAKKKGSIIEAIKELCAS